MKQTNLSMISDIHLYKAFYNDKRNGGKKMEENLKEIEK